MILINRLLDDVKSSIPMRNRMRLILILEKWSLDDVDKLVAELESVSGNADGKAIGTFEYDHESKTQKYTPSVSAQSLLENSVSELEKATEKFKVKTITPNVGWIAQCKTSTLQVIVTKTNEHTFQGIVSKADESHQLYQFGHYWSNDAFTFIEPDGKSGLEVSTTPNIGWMAFSKKLPNFQVLVIHGEPKYSCDFCGRVINRSETLYEDGKDYNRFQIDHFVFVKTDELVKNKPEIGWIAINKEDNLILEVTDGTPYENWMFCGKYISGGKDTTTMWSNTYVISEFTFHKPD